MIVTLQNKVQLMLSCGLSCMARPLYHKALLLAVNINSLTIFPSNFTAAALLLTGAVTDPFSPYSCCRPHTIF